MFAHILDFSLEHGFNCPYVESIANFCLLEIIGFSLPSCHLPRREAHLLWRTSLLSPVVSSSPDWKLNIRCSNHNHESLCVTKLGNEVKTTHPEDFHCLLADLHPPRLEHFDATQVLQERKWSIAKLEFITNCIKSENKSNKLGSINSQEEPNQTTMALFDDFC